MFFRKKREAAAAKAAEARNDILRTIDEKFSDAVESRDPAEKILKLEDQKKAIDTFIETAEGDIKAKAKGKWLGGYFGATIGTTLAIDVVSIALVGMPASTLFMLPSIMIGWFTGDKRVETARKKMVAENTPFFDELRSKRARAEEATVKAMETDMRDFAESPKFQQLLERVPSLRQKFAESYRRHIDGSISDLPPPKKKDPGLHL
ncbi:MAG TPA: hypothetical protein VEF76_04475 [Patescibacteria group bacterium]|nr:hypothetical protein [Patescibacteria group bacterium]